VSVRLRPMREDEYEAFHAVGVERYVRELEVNGGLEPEHARAKGVDDFAQLLPQGLGSPDQFVLVIEDDEGRPVGDMWWALRQNRVGSRYAYLYDITIDDAERGRGLGRAAMHALEVEVRTHGLERIELNVFGGNEVARGLYRSLGYAEAAVHMDKKLA
jgi:ribosomal protein S18 acetylase RimI-like enzyme